MSLEDGPVTVDALLRTAAAADARAARAVLARIDGVRLIELVATQAELAVDEERSRPAGIDAVGDLERAAIEVMGLPQGLGPDPEEDDEDVGPPTVTGWELLTVAAEDLHAATMTVEVPSWALALVAFVDGADGAGRDTRHVVAATADGRFVTAHLELRGGLAEADLLAATLTSDAGALGADAGLATSLSAALEDAANGR